MLNTEKRIFFYKNIEVTIHKTCFILSCHHKPFSRFFMDHDWIKTTEEEAIKEFIDVVFREGWNAKLYQLKEIKDQ